jgi:2-polyprenyl-3-methyl-5-hydroxy-6-metoxy-1,4-benzoquinol methylase
MREATLRILPVGESVPQSDWLHQGLMAIGHEILDPESIANPDVVLVHDPSATSGTEIRAWRRNGVCTLLRAWNDPESLERCADVAGEYDFVLTTGLAEMVRLYADCGARALPLLPSSPPVAQSAAGEHRDIDIVFAGRLDGTARRHRLEFLREAATRWRVAVASVDHDFWPAAVHPNADVLDALHRRARLAFHMDAISVNRFGVTRRCPSTRAFFGAAHRTVLLAELRQWLTHCFDPEAEMVGFSDVDHALDVAGAILKDQARLQVMAERAFRRSVREHAPPIRARQIAALAAGHIPLEMSVLALGPWYQQIDLPGGGVTSHLTQSNVHRWARLQPCFPDVRGRRVLDLGMNAGYFSLQCTRLGASRVVGVDSSSLACAQARFVRDIFGATQMEIIEADVTDAPPEDFDMCLLLAVLHHVANIHPVLAAATRRASTLLVEWEVRPQPYFHPIEEVVGTLDSLGWQSEIKEGGGRPILIARRTKPPSG